VPLGGEPSLDPVARRRPRHDQPVLPGTLVPQERSAVHDLVLERKHLVDESSVLLRDRIDRLDPRDEIVETASAEFCVSEV